MISNHWTHLTFAGRLSQTLCQPPPRVGLQAASYTGHSGPVAYDKLYQYGTLLSWSFSVHACMHSVYVWICFQLWMRVRLSVYCRGMGMCLQASSPSCVYSSIFSPVLSLTQAVSWKVKLISLERLAGQQTPRILLRYLSLGLQMCIILNGSHWESEHRSPCFTARTYQLGHLPSPRFKFLLGDFFFRWLVVCFSGETVVSCVLGFFPVLLLIS